MEIREIINIYPEIMGGCPVFMGTRVPVESLFWHLEDGVSLDDFLDDFPTVPRELAVALLVMVSKIASAKNIAELYAAAA